MNITLRISSRSKGGNIFCFYLTSEVVSPFNSLPPSMHNLYQRNVLGDILLYCIVYAVAKLNRSIYSGIVFSLVNHVRVLDDSNFHMLHNSDNLCFIFFMRKNLLRGKSRNETGKKCWLFYSRRSHDQAAKNKLNTTNTIQQTKYELLKVFPEDSTA